MNTDIALSIPLRSRVAVFGWAVMLFCMPLVVSAADPGACADKADCFSFSDEAKALFWCAVAGAFGGLVYSAKDSKLSCPGIYEPRSLELGWIADVLFGVAGGIVIFMLYPGEFNIPEGKGAVTTVVKLAGLGIVGGYGGRLFLEKATSSRLAGIEDEVKNIKEKDQVDANVAATIDRILDENPEGDQPTQEELTASLRKVSHSIQVDAFKSARAFRKKMTLKVYDDAADVKEVGRKGLLQAQKVLTSLAEIDEVKQYHRTYAQLAYINRSLEKYEKAIECFDQAIKIRTKSRLEGYRVYEFGRAACRAMQSPEEVEAILADLDEAVRVKGEAYNRMRPLHSNYEKELRGWFEAHPEALARFKTKHDFDPMEV